MSEVEDNVGPTPTVYLYDVIESLKPGDILHIQVGAPASEMGDGMPPFVPSDQDLAETHREWKKVVPEGVNVITTHIWEHARVIPVEHD